MPETTTQPHGVPCFMRVARKMRSEPADDQRDAQHQGQHGRRLERVLDADEAGEDIERAEQQPQQAMRPSPWR